MKIIKKLTGKSAKAYYAQQQSENVDPWINPINYVLAELRAKALEFMRLDLNYFHIRHRYISSERRLLDNMYICRYEGYPNKEAQTSGAINNLRYRYLKFIYRSEINKKYEWIRVTSHAEKSPVFVWHEDIDEYHKQRI